MYSHPFQVVIPELDPLGGGEKGLEVLDHLLAGAAGLVCGQAALLLQGRQLLETPRLLQSRDGHGHQLHFLANCPHLHWTGNNTVVPNLEDAAIILSICGGDGQHGGEENYSQVHCSLLSIKLRLYQLEKQYNKLYHGGWQFKAPYQNCMTCRKQGASHS